MLFVFVQISIFGTKIDMYYGNPTADPPNLVRYGSTNIGNYYSRPEYHYYMVYLYDEYRWETQTKAYVFRRDKNVLLKTLFYIYFYYHTIIDQGVRVRGVETALHIANMYAALWSCLFFLTGGDKFKHKNKFFRFD